MNLCSYNAHLTLCLSHAAIPVFAEPVLRVPPVTPEKILTLPALSDGGPEGERTASGYPPAYLGISDWSIFSAANVPALAALEDGRALSRKFAGAVPVLDRAVTLLGESPLSHLPTKN